MSELSASPPGLHPLIPKLCQAVLNLVGWRVEGDIPQLSKFVVICAPHTSNWDAIYMWLCAGALNFRVSWMGKDALFRWPYGFAMRWLGGMPIIRHKRHNVVQQMAQTFAEREKLIVGILPEGTRRKRDHWKSGFYYIAQQAGVPILLSFLDYRRKLCYMGPTLTPSGDVEADLKIIREFYKDVRGKYPKNVSDIRFKTRKA